MLSFNRPRVARAPYASLVGMILLLAGAEIFAEGAGAAVATGRIAGVVRYTGTVPPAKRVTVTDGSTLEHHDLVVDPATKGLRDVIVVLENAPAQPALEEAKPVVVDQIDWLFKPRVVAVQHGQAVRFENSDIVNHSVMAVSTRRANQLNSVAAPGRPIVHAFEPQRQPIMIGCSLHPWMRAWVYVSAHPWFALSDEKGRFEIVGIPPGRYSLLLLHPDTGHREQRTVEVTAGNCVELAVDWSGEKGP